MPTYELPSVTSGTFLQRQALLPEFFVAPPFLASIFETPIYSAGGSVAETPLLEPGRPAEPTLVLSEGQVEAIFPGLPSLAPGAQNHRLVVYGETGTVWTGSAVQAGQAVTALVEANQKLAAVWVAERVRNGAVESNRGVPRLFGQAPAAPSEPPLFEPGQPAEPAVVLDGTQVEATFPGLPFLTPGAEHHRLVVYGELGVAWEGVPVQAGQAVTALIEPYSIFAAVWVAERSAEGVSESNRGVPRFFGYQPSAPTSCYIPPNPQVEFIEPQAEGQSPQVFVNSPEVMPGAWELDLWVKIGDYGPLQVLAEGVGPNVKLDLSDFGFVPLPSTRYIFQWKPRQTL